MTLRSTERFRREQIDLLREVEGLPVMAHELPGLPVQDRIEVVEHVVTFLAEILLPHAEAEQRILYPEARRLFGHDRGSRAVAQGAIDPNVAPRAAALEREGERSMAIDLLGHYLATAPDDGRAWLQLGRLYALHALLAIHLEHETEVYLRLVQSQPDEPVRRLFRRVTEHPPDYTPAA